MASTPIEKESIMFLVPLSEIELLTYKNKNKNKIQKKLKTQKYKKNRALLLILYIERSDLFLLCSVKIYDQLG